MPWSRLRGWLMEANCSLCRDLEWAHQQKCTEGNIATKKWQLRFCYLCQKPSMLRTLRESLKLWGTQLLVWLTGGSSLRSTNVVYFYGAVIEPKICMVLEFCSRGSLYDVLKDESNVVDWPKVIKIITDAVKGVSCLHNWKPQIVHRDLKSLNLLVH